MYTNKISHSQEKVPPHTVTGLSGKRGTQKIPDHRPTVATQRALQLMAWDSLTGNPQPQMLVAGELSSAPPVIQRVKYVKTSTEKIKEVDDNYRLGWGERFVDGPAPTATDKVEAPVDVIPELEQERAPEPEIVAPPQPALTAEERGYPYGFESMEQFRDLTRPIARANRNAEIVVTGSSVTGKSGDGTRDFRPRGTPKEHGNKKSGPSDIDVGIVRPGSRGQGQVQPNGFPKYNSRLHKQERRFGQSVESTIGHPAGIKYFNAMPVEKGGHRRGRSRFRERGRERRRIVRDHTPERDRGGEG